ncbi:hypothetical protein COCON_G00069630 [Conger conger]|uniref:Exocyst complex component 2 n=1 Tax=Conger conger TaxID=82655 RepID=A0A9Q1DT34_CONCO|nr:hypothetical protein COCON_G00069630 [Conger conger]
MSRSRQPPLVTGISPNEGTPWTKVTIRGENLGTGPADLIGLSICGHNCLLTAEWMSASKIVCRVGPAKDDKGEIIVTTKSGGNGTSTVSFKLLKTEKIGILDQSAVWVEEMNYYDMRTDRNKGISPLSLRPANPLGIDIDKSKVPQKDLESMFPGMSGDFTSENFSATWYLIENHSATSFDQLRIAAQNLRKQANKKNEGSLAYVKGVSAPSSRRRTPWQRSPGQTKQPRPGPARFLTRFKGCENEQSDIRRRRAGGEPGPWGAGQDRAGAGPAGERVSTETLLTDTRAGEQIPGIRRRSTPPSRSSGRSRALQSFNTRNAAGVYFLDGVWRWEPVATCGVVTVTARQLQRADGALEMRRGTPRRPSVRPDERQTSPAPPRVCHNSNS